MPASESRSTSELLQIAATGGGFRLNASARPINELIQIAPAAGNKGGRIYPSGMSNRPTAELIQIAAAGKGVVVFEE